MIRYELYQIRLQTGTLLFSLSFFALALFGIALACGPEEKILAQAAPALFWILTLLTTLFSIPLFLKSEAQAGLLDERLLQPIHPAFYFISTSVANTLLLGLPLIILAILFSPLFFLSLSELIFLSLTLLIAFPALSSLGLLGGLLTLNAQGGALLTALLILPLTFPLLLFALSAIEMARLGLDSFAPFCLLTSTSLLLVILAAGMGSWAFRLAGER